MTIRPRQEDWREISATYGDHIEPHEAGLAEEIAEILREAGIAPPARLLEAGSGSGHLSLILNRHGYATDLLDFDPEALERSRQSFLAAGVQEGDRAAFLPGDLLNLQETLRDREPYDLVWNSGVLEHFSADALTRAYQQMSACSAAGRIFALVPNPASVVYLAYRDFVLKQDRWNVGVEFLRDDYVDIAAGCGLRCVRRGHCGRAYTGALLRVMLPDGEVRRSFEAVIDGHHNDEASLYLTYFIFEPTEAQPPMHDAVADATAIEVRMHQDSDPTIDKTFYLDSLGAVNAAKSQLTRRVEELQRECERLREEIPTAKALLAAIEQGGGQSDALNESLTAMSMNVAEVRQWTRDASYFQARLAAAETERAELAAALERERSAAEGLRAESSRAQEDAAARQQEIDSIRARHGQTEARLRESEAQLQRLNAELAHRTVQHAAAANAATHARAALDMLEAFKDHRGFRAAHYLQMARNHLAQGPLRERMHFARRAAERLVGRHRGEFGPLNALNLPQAHIRAAIQAVEQATATAPSPAPAAAQESIIPPPAPVRVPAPSTRRPHGQRRVAVLTNQLLDWHDQRPRFGGGERYAWTLAQLMTDLGLQVHFFQTSMQPFESTYHGFPVTGMTEVEWFSEFNHGACRRFTQLARDFDHVVHNMIEYATGPVREDALAICHGIWFDHDNAPMWQFRSRQWFEHLGRAFGGAHRMVSVDTNSVNVIRALWPALVSRMTYIPNFFNPQDFYPRQGERPDGPLRILFPRRSQRTRGSRILEDILRQTPGDVRFAWVGEGDAEDTQLILDLCKRDPRLSFHRADFHEMPEWYRWADICVIPTIACEGTSLSCIEALATGLPTISTNVGGLPDIVHPGLNGLLVDPTAEAIAEALRRLAADGELRERLRDGALKSLAPFRVDSWRRRWARILLQEGWVTEEALARAGLDTVTDASAGAPETPPSARALRCAIVTRNAIHGGVETAIAMEAEHLGADVIVSGGHEQPQTCPFTYEREDTFDGLKQRLQNYDAILYHWPSPTAVQAIADSGVPSIEYVHRVDTSDCDKSVPGLLMAHSPFLAAHQHEQFGRACEVVQLPVDLDRFQPAEQLGRYIGGPTSYNKFKAIDVFIRAWAEVGPEFPDLKARFYGSGPLKEELEALSQSLGANVELLGPVPDPERMLREFRLFCLSSNLEGMPLTCHEALCMDIPVVASDLPGVADFNRLAELRGFGQPMRTFPIGDHKALAHALRAALAEQQRASTREYMTLYYAPQVHARKVRDALASAAMSGRRVPWHESGLRTWKAAPGRIDADSAKWSWEGPQGATPIEPSDDFEASPDRKLRVDLQLPRGADALEVIAVLNEPATATWQIDALDEAGQFLGSDFGACVFTAGRPYSLRGKPLPAGTRNVRFYLTPHEGDAPIIQELTAVASAAVTDAHANGSPPPGSTGPVVVRNGAHRKEGQVAR